MPPTAKQRFEAAQAAEQGGRLAEAEQLYRGVLKLAPAHAEAHAALGFLALRGGRADLSQSFLAKARALEPRLGDRFTRKAEALARERRWAEAADAWQRALAIHPGDAGALIGLAEALSTLGRAEAVQAAEDAAARAPDHAALQLRAAGVLAESGVLGKAAAVAERAQAVAPHETAAPLRLGQIRRDQGRLTEASALFRQALTLDPSLAEAWLYLSELERFEPAEIDRMEALLSRAGDAAAAVPLLFALGKAYDDQGDYDRAFARLERGNRSMAARLRYDPGKDEAWADRIISGFDAKLFKDRHGQGEPSRLPVLILGMPRSGSTLAEQILASHPAVHGAGEIAEVGRMLEDLAHLHPGATDYVAACRTMPSHVLKRIGTASVARLQELTPGKERVTNKTPGNVFHLGFVHLALPEARFVETRRDPIETCFACWRMLFRSGVAFSYDLEHLGRYYKLHDRLMRHWRALLPDRVFTLSYEGLVENQETVSRQLVDFVGLTWDPACLDFHRTERAVMTASGAQVRQPLAKKPSQRWRNYERHLGPLIEALAGDVL
jgi:tetratricopeptide (TPR) repeat protein